MFNMLHDQYSHMWQQFCGMNNYCDAHGSIYPKINSWWCGARSITPATLCNTITTCHTFVIFLMYSYKRAFISWPSSPPHWLSRKRNTGHVKPPSPSYFVNFRGLRRSNGLIVRMLAAVDGFSRALPISLFDSPWMYCFCVVLTSLFYVLLVTFYFLLVFYCSLCSLIFTWP